MMTGPEVAQQVRRARQEVRRGVRVRHRHEDLAKTATGSCSRPTTATSTARCAVVVTAGGEARKLGVPGEAELAGTGVSYCAVCDGAFFQDRLIAVVGGGDSAIEEGAFLTRYASKVYVIHRRDEFRASPLLVEHLDHTGKAEKVLNTVVEEIVGDDKVTGLRVKNVETGETVELAVDAVFPFVGFTPHSDIFEDGPG